jgi:HAD superfamily hydrolase (TIGR01509 family)
VSQTKAIFLDALGTLVELEPPWVGLREALGEGVADDRLVPAVRAEMAYYKAHSHEGRDAESLEDLRRRCAELLSRELGTEVDVGTLVDSIRFAPYPDAVPALEGLRELELKRVCVSNWDCSLGTVLERCGLAAHLDGAVSSAEAGAQKPEPEIFEAALRFAGVEALDVVHVGDTREEDIAGAEAAGIRALLLDREGGGDVASLEEVAGKL